MNIAEKVHEELLNEGRKSNEILPIYNALVLLERRVSGVPFKSKVMSRLKIELKESNNNGTSYGRFDRIPFDRNPNGSFI